MRRESELMWLPSAVSAYHTALWVASRILTEPFDLLCPVFQGMTSVFLVLGKCFNEYTVYGDFNIDCSG